MATRNPVGFQPPSKLAVDTVFLVDPVELAEIDRQQAELELWAAEMTSEQWVPREDPVELLVVRGAEVPAAAPLARVEAARAAYLEAIADCWASQTASPIEGRC